MAKDSDDVQYKIEHREVEIGKTYPLYGYITKIIDDTFENFTVEINNGISLKCTFTAGDCRAQIKERAFEPGIFVARITGLNPVKGECGSMVFGPMVNTDLM